MRNYLKPGDWNCICDVCGFEFKASQIRKRWDGLMTCPSDFELRNPLDFLRVPADRQSVPWARPEGPDTFIAGPTPLQTEANVPIFTEPLEQILQTES